MFDQKKWGQALSCLLHDKADHISHVATLYLASQITANPSEILLMTQGQHLDICVSEPELDPQIKKVIENPEKFPSRTFRKSGILDTVGLNNKNGAFPKFHCYSSQC